MKTLVLSLTLVLAAAGTAQAQVFRPSTTTGAVLGATAGGLIGGHNGDRWAEGMVIGGVVGAVLGSAVDSAREQQVYTSAPQTVYAPAPVQTAPTVANAPVAYPAPQVVYAPAPQPQVVYAPAPQPQVVYVQSAPVYVSAPPPVVYAPRPVFSVGVYSGPRYYDRGHNHRGPHGRW